MTSPERGGNVTPSSEFLDRLAISVENPSNTPTTLPQESQNSTQLLFAMSTARVEYLNWLDEVVLDLLRQGSRSAQQIREEVMVAYGIDAHIHHDIGWCLYEGQTARIVTKIENVKGGRWAISPRKVRANSWEQPSMLRVD